jgi:hypothetical protein
LWAPGRRVTIGFKEDPMGERVVVAPKRRESNHRRALLAGLAALLLIGGLAVTQLPRLLSSSTQPTVWQTITAGITDGTVPKDVALEAFAYLYQVDIPGVTVPNGVDAADRPTSGSGALRWVQANWDQLTPDQQAVINDVMTPGPGDVVLHVDATAGLPAPSTSPSAVVQPAGPLGLPAAVAVVPPVDQGEQARPGAPSPQLQAAIEAELKQDIQHIGQKLGMPMIKEGIYPWNDVTLTISDKSHGTVVMTAKLDHNNAGHLNPCAVTVWKDGWQDETGVNGVSPLFHVVMTHEVIHCYQHVIEGDVDTSLAIPEWISEGSALWLAASDTGVEELQIHDMWIKGWFQPELALSNRTYDAFGYYALLDHLGRNLWGLMVPAWKAASTTPAGRSNAFIAVLNGDAPDVRNVWASSYLREQSWGDPWIAYGFWIPSEAKAERHPVQAVPDPGTSGSLLSRSNTVLDVDDVSGEVAIVSTSGLASVHDQAGASLLAFQDATFCVSGTCVCPDNTLRAGEHIADQHLSVPFIVALNAPEGGSNYTIEGAKLVDICGRAATPKPPKPGASGPCAGGCGNSNGDPHMLTVNSYRYDFQAAGEFTLLRSSDGSLEMQARQEPFESLPGFGAVATNTAIAARVGGHRVGIYATGAALKVRIDGSVVDATAAQDLGGGARISPYPKGVELDFPDGTKLWALSVGRYGINALVLPSSTLNTSGGGLLGPIVPGGLGVPALPDGTRLPAATDRHARHATVYGQFADAWRVTDSTTLFDYDGGKSTASYTQKSYPPDTTDVKFSDDSLGDLTPDQQSAGNSACGAITDAGLHDDCVFDVGVSGDSGFATSYEATQEFYDSGIVAPTPAPQGTTIVVTPGPGTVSGAVAVTPALGLSGYAAGPDNKLYLSVKVSSNQATLFEVDPTTGSTLHQVDVPAVTEVHVAGGSVWLPGLKTDSHGNNCSVTRFDAQTLAEGATIAIPCSFIGGPNVVSDGSALWFVDVTRYDGGTQKGAVLTRIDPSSNAFGPSVDLPFVNGFRFDSQGALFYFDTNSDSSYYRLEPGQTSMTKLLPFVAGAHAGGTGLWVPGNSGNAAQFFSDPGGPQVNLPIDGTLVGGDANAAYVERDTSNGTELWRYPSDGSASTQIGTAPAIDGQGQSYFADPQAIVAPGGFIKLWLLQATGTATPTLYFQWVPLP